MFIFSTVNCWLDKRRQQQQSHVMTMPMMMISSLFFTTRNLLGKKDAWLNWIKELSVACVRVAAAAVDDRTREGESRHIHELSLSSPLVYREEHRARRESERKIRCRVRARLAISYIHSSFAAQFEKSITIVRTPKRNKPATCDQNFQLKFSREVS